MYIEFTPAGATQEVSFGHLYFNADIETRTKAVEVPAAAKMLIQVAGNPVHISSNENAGREGMYITCKNPVIMDREATLYVHAPYGTTKVFITPGGV